MRRTNATIAGFAAVALTLVGCSSGAGEPSGEEAAYPTGDIRLQVPFGAGGETDTATRALAPMLEEALGVSVIVENRPGANGTIGYGWLLDQPADGYSVSMLGPEIATIQFQGYDVDPADFKFVGRTTEAPGAIAVAADSPFQTLDDLIEAAQADPEGVSYSVSGSGSIWDVAGFRFMDATDTRMTSVPFDGSAPAVEGAAGGHVDATFAPISTIAPQVEGGSMRFLAMLTEERREEFPDVPTATEQGIELVHSSWSGMMVQADVPDATVQVLSDALATAVESEEFGEIAGRAGLVPSPVPYPGLNDVVSSLSTELEPLFERYAGESTPQP